MNNLKWFKYLLREEEDKKPSNITFKSGKLVDLIADNRRIKRLRVPSWILQTDVYPSNDPKSIAAVAYDNGEPVAIVTISKDKYTDHALVNQFVDVWHRGLNLSTKLLNMVLEVSDEWETIIGSRRTYDMLKRRGFEEFSKSCPYQDCVVFKNKHYKGEPLLTLRKKRIKKSKA